MTRLMVDERTARMLNGSNDPLFVCDPSGKVIGRFVPQSLYDGLVIPFTEEEIQQAEAETEEFTLAEILAELEKR